MRRLVVVAAALLVWSLTIQAVDFNVRTCMTPGSEIFWSGMQRFVTMNHSKGDSFDKTKFRPTAFALGYQYSAERWQLGFSLSYETGNLQHKYTDSGWNAKVRDRTLGVTLFGTYWFGDGFYAKGSSIVGFTKQKVKDGYDGVAPITGRNSTSSTRYGASLEFGKVFEHCNFRFTPHAGFDFAYFPGKDIPYRDGTGDNSIRWKSQDFYEIPFGVSFAKDFVNHVWVITPSVDLTAISSLGKTKDRNYNGRPGFSSRTGSEWRVYGIGAGHWGGRATAGVKAIRSERLDLEFYYAYEGWKKFHDHRLMATIGVAF